MKNDQIVRRIEINDKIKIIINGAKNERKDQPKNSKHQNY